MESPLDCDEPKQIRVRDWLTGILQFLFIYFVEMAEEKKRLRKNNSSPSEDQSPSVADEAPLDFAWEKDEEFDSGSDSGSQYTLQWSDEGSDEALNAQVSDDSEFHGITDDDLNDEELAEARAKFFAPIDSDDEYVRDVCFPSHFTFTNLQNENNLFNAIGNIPEEWYNDFDHVGYDQAGNKIARTDVKNSLDEILAKADGADAW